MERENKVPVKRVGFFYSEEDFKLDMQIANEYVKNDLNFKVILYRIDLVNTQTNIYGETKAKNISYLDPIEVNVYSLNLESPEAKTFGDGKLKYTDFGSLSFAITSNELTEKTIDIKNGDIIGYNVDEKIFKYFEVVDDGRMVYNNPQMFNGYKSSYRKVKCVHKDITEFNGR
jgi:hypothetical protein